MISIKDRNLSLIQKIIVIFLAFLLLVTMMPVGLFTGSDDHAAEGSFVRRLPSAEVFADVGDSQVRKIDGNSCLYYKFDISDLADMKQSEIHEVTFRISFMGGSGVRENAVNVSVVKSEDFPSRFGREYNALKKVLYGEPVVKWNPKTSEGEDVVCEVDMTEYAKELLNSGKKEVCVKVSTDAEIPLLTASAEHTDEAYRPCLKSVTGIAEDTDADVLKKAELTESACLSREGEVSSEQMLLGGGNELYLKFEINKNAILGSLYSARLMFTSEDIVPGDAKFKIYVLNNSEWTSENISRDNRPKGEEEIAVSKVYAETNTITADITQKICEAIDKGIYTLTLRVTCDADAVKICGTENGGIAPKLCLKSTDRDDISSVSEAALRAYGRNKTDYVTMNLLNSYSAKNNVRISWTECDEYGENKESSRYISANGEITRPKWFEDDTVVSAAAEIRSGDYTAIRYYTLKFTAETAPDYSKYKFSDYINIGNSQSEAEQKFECVNVDNAKRRWANGSVFDYRVPQQDGVMVLNFACSPYEKNYLTFKLWEEPYGSPCQINVVPFGMSKTEIVSYEVPESGELAEGGFMYVTYALPESFTKGKSNVTLIVGVDYQTDKNRGFYAAYMTQNPFFEPKQFAEKGEKTISGFSLAEGSIRKIIYGIKATIGGEKTENSNEEISEMPVINKDTGSVVFVGKDVNIVFDTDIDRGVTSVYQSTGEYERYCSECPVTVRDGVLEADYGGYTMIWNMNSHKEIGVQSLTEEFSGVYAEVTKGEYYSFSEEWQMTDDSAVPDGKQVLDGNLLTVAPNEAVLLRHISDPMQSAQWRVKMINGYGVSDVSPGDTEKIDYVSVKAVGGIPDSAEKLYVMVEVYEGDKIIAISRKEANIYGDIDYYGLDFSDETLYMKRGRTIKVFAYDNTDSLTEITPVLELPRSDG